MTSHHTRPPVKLPPMPPLCAPAPAIPNHSVPSNPCRPFTHPPLQGGTFVFRGPRLMWAHRNAVPGDDPTLDQVGGGSAFISIPNKGRRVHGWRTCLGGGRRSGVQGQQGTHACV